MVAGTHHLCINLPCKSTGKWMTALHVFTLLFTAALNGMTPWMVSTASAGVLKIGLGGLCQHDFEHAAK